MKIAVIYFEEKLSSNRNHHEVSHQILKGWQRFYDMSKSKATPCMLTDKNTTVPSFWKYDHIVVEDSEPPQRQDVLNKVGWLKHQAYDLLGKCVVMDLDALLKTDIDELFDIDKPIAMAPDIGTAKEWHWAKEWPEAKLKYNAGVLYLNSPKISVRFKELWNDKNKFLNVTYFDEIIFSAILKEMNGEVIENKFNTLWEGKEEKDAKVIHFSGERKKDLLKYFAKSIL